MQVSEDVTSVVEVIAAECLPPSAPLVACEIDLPKTGDTSESYLLHVRGWVLSPEATVCSVEFVTQGGVWQSVAVDRDRPDVKIAYPEATKDDRCGFEATVTLLWLEQAFELTLWAVLTNGERAPLGIIRGRRRALRSSYQPQLQPLRLTTLGRTGSTWVTHLLSQHREIVAYQPFLFEPRVASYWLQLLKDVSRPESQLQSVFATDLIRPHWWLTGESESGAGLGLLSPEIQRLLTRDTVEAVATLCLSRIDEFYLRVDNLRNNNAGRYFVEKAMPSAAPEVMEELYPGTKDIFIVRDFRDMAASIFAMNAKRGKAAFGRERFASDEEYLTDGLRIDALALLTEWKRRSHGAYLLRYENVIREPGETLRSVFDYIGVENSEAIVEAVLQGASARLPEAEQHRTSIDPAHSIGRWRSDLTPRLQEVCEGAFGEVMEEFGYQ